jgi:hypothetical protein
VDSERSRGYCSLVQPDHPAVRALLSQWLPEPLPPEAALDQFCALVALCDYSSAPGSNRDLADVAGELAGNCLDLSVLAVSGLRAAGFPTAYVLIGSGAGSFPVAIHAWALVGVGDALVTIDPTDGSRRETNPADLLERISPLALFNETECFRGIAGVRDALRLADADAPHPKGK